MTDAPPPYPGITGNSGYAAPSSHTNGAAGGIQTGYYDPNNPQMGFVPPPPLPSAVCQCHTETDILLHQSQDVGLKCIYLFFKKRREICRVSLGLKNWF